MRLMLIPLIAAIAGGPALAQTVERAPRPPKTYPLCSATVKDECVNPSQAPQKATPVKTAAPKPDKAGKPKMVPEKNGKPK